MGIEKSHNSAIKDPPEGGKKYPNDTNHKQDQTHLNEYFSYN
jgi:hypothetical protein